DSQTATADVLTRELERFLKICNIEKDASCLIVGLGNRNVTPDALGPETVERILVTNHLFNLHPEYVSEGYRPVSAIAPGVMGVTGIETSDTIFGIIEKV